MCVMDAPTLAAALRVRVPLTDGEAATVAIPLAVELDEWHARGLAYGPMSGEDVVFEPNGRPTLAGRPGQVEGADEDIGNLLRVVLGAMVPPAPDDDVRLSDVLSGLLAAGCASGQEVADACFATVEPEPVRLPDAGALARGQMLAGDEARAALPRPGRSPLPRGAAVSTTPTRGAARRRARRRSRVTRLAAVAVAVVAVAVAGVLLHLPASGAPVASPAAVVVDPVLDREAPGAAAAALTRQRAVVLGTGEGAGLDVVDLVGGPARAADEELLASLGGDRLDGLSVDVQAVSLVGGEGDEAWVAVTSAMSPYRRVGESGAAAVPGTSPRTVVLLLRWTDDGWRVWSVEPTSDVP